MNILKLLRTLAFCLLSLGIFWPDPLLLAQPRPGRPPMRKHSVTQKRSWSPVPATEALRFQSKQSFEAGRKQIKVSANGIPGHKVGRFPNRGNPHTIGQQAYGFSIPANQKPAEKPVSLHNDTGRGPPNTHPPRGFADDPSVGSGCVRESRSGDVERRVTMAYAILLQSSLLGL